jgi:protoheme IX farnesyltransferase
MIGWAAVTGTVSLESAVLFLVIFLWTPPHFWALALYRAGDYAKAGVPMLPVVAGKAETRKWMLVYALLLFPVTIAPAVLGVAGLVYGVAAAALGGFFIFLALRVLSAATDDSARRMFGFSVLYLFLLFALLIVDRAPGLAAGGLG